MLRVRPGAVQAGNLRGSKRQPILVHIPLVDFPANPTACDRAHAADEKTYEHVRTERLRCPPEYITDDGGSNEDGKLKHGASLDEDWTVSRSFVSADPPPGENLLDATCVSSVS
jgi:hypothetical protein